ncbi:hypothetical protein BGW38_006557 [Lunasporangiospora selenospora]|uniref:Uncharacterized protein n=1 Tax=Lunasporangiospora selenospora TaxID=979761 RepID=A0A9P6FZ23_9FUNG|nr:hypothetical protein BGW38_006557 [Lunasporangiospora selenospora]
MPQMPRVFWAIFTVFIAVLAAGMFLGDPEELDLVSKAPSRTSPSNEDPMATSEYISSSQVPPPPPQCSNPSGWIGDACCDYEMVGKLNVDFSARLKEIVSMPFFRFFKVNLYKDCPFWGNNGLCMNRDCSVETMDESRVPEKWKTQSLSKVSLPQNNLFGASAPLRPALKDQDFCVPDEGSEEVYVDLQDNPERFTGYSGPSAAMVWKAIYEENCFDVSKEMTAGCQYCESERLKLEEQKQQKFEDEKKKLQQRQQRQYEQKQQTKQQTQMQTQDVYAEGQMTDSSKSTLSKKKMTDNILIPPEPAPMTSIKPTREEMNDIFARLPKGKGELQQLLDDMAKDDGPEESCLEKRVYYRLISGLHSSISIHICDEWFNQTSGEWGPNLDCFISRVGKHPERLENIYFDYVVLLRAITKISDYLAGYEYCTGDDMIDMNIMTVVNELVDLAKKCPPTFDERLLFQSQDKSGRHLKQQFRDHFRNVTRIMDCVGCEKCRLWGKVQTLGLGTALKLLFSYDDESLQGHKADGVLTRTEIVALLNTFNRLSESIAAIERFGNMYQQRLDEEQRKYQQQQQQQRKATSRVPNSKHDSHHHGSHAGHAHGHHHHHHDHDHNMITRPMYKVWVWLSRLGRRMTVACQRVDKVLEDRHITQHRALFRSIASWMH